MMIQEHKWIACQLGAREHYAIPRALHSTGKLGALLTEAWVPPRSAWGRLRRNLRERYHPDVPPERVHACTAGAVAFEASASMRGSQGWERILRRNEWFQHRVGRMLELEKCPARQEHGTLFSFSYTAGEPFRWAKRRGWRTVLGQIDGALGEEQHIAGLHARHEGLAGNYRAAPPVYWEKWRKECDLADSIVVNSEWSRKLLELEGVDGGKIEIIPLAYRPSPESRLHSRKYPEKFDTARPLRVLFLGQVSVRKGVIELLEAARILSDRPVEFWMVGPEVFPVPRNQQDQKQLRWFGAVSRATAAEYYRNADVFLFPTHSDGFGLTQLEAQAWKLPLISSPHCGRVVKPGISGLEMAEVSAQAIVHAIETCLNRPDLLAEWSQNSDDLSAYSIENLAARLLSLP